MGLEKALDIPEYGPGENCNFDDFPQQIRVVIGNILLENTGLSILNNNETIRLSQTSLSNTEQGDKIVGEKLPQKRIIYTDTGDDSYFDLKITYFGWGKLYLTSEEDDHFSVSVTKGMTVQAGDWNKEKVFAKTLLGNTEVDATEDLQNEFSVEIVKHDAGLEFSSHTLQEDDDGSFDVKEIDTDDVDFSGSSGGGGCSPDITVSESTDETKRYEGQSIDFTKGPSGSIEIIENANSKVDFNNIYSSGDEITIEGSQSNDRQFIVQSIPEPHRLIVSGRMIEENDANCTLKVITACSVIKTNFDCSIETMSCEEFRKQATTIDPDS